MLVFSAIIAPIIVGCVLSIFNYWLENRCKKTRSRR
ncbi:type I toxin-antitoxin system Fst family toxin [Listeria booriae]|nr:type I toxin-antitoxin system Fst family toxin [Listeria booriae]MBC1292776.1 type I toxin-antitoxin system Fst family toxin [Listeria booriae]MBC1336006.1 type I toxin-antitoxin system Fst family toxin [Listeria booriae]MBC1651091.1 type I toxin-antitoxin system Fst family toxin [Listeria booriae]MBC1945982.1 type I toxin-antitoxin system Fst family toxin [Listeria booriae]MBC6127280.1 type I toxin-antitoxin system Fst family toxin [Listeria booriae]